MVMAVRGIRGAITVEKNTPEAIERATQELLLAILERNGLDPAGIISVFLTATTDLDADYPAAAARKLGWTDIPLLDAQEIDVQNGMERVIRVLMHAESSRARAEIHHVYLGRAARLRPDLAE
jgi:chorismate mutase